MTSPSLLLDRLVRFWNRPRWQKKLLVEAFALLFVARMAVIFLPFKSVTGWCGIQGLEMPDMEAPLPILRQVKWAVTTASRYGWWNCLCLTQAIAAKAMLRRRGVESTIYLGVTRPGVGDFSAHAWLCCGRFILTGAEGREHFATVAKFT